MLHIRNDLPSPNYLGSIRRRQRNVLRFATHLRQEEARFHSLNSASLTNHFATLEVLMEQYNLDAERIFNLDEVGVSPDQDFVNVSRMRLLLPCTTRSISIYRRLAAWKYHNCFTMMPVVSAAGCMGPMLFVKNAERVPYGTCVPDGIAVTKSLVCNFPRYSVLAHNQLLLVLTQHRFYRGRGHLFPPLAT